MKIKLNMPRLGTMLLLIMACYMSIIQSVASSESIIVSYGICMIGCLYPVLCSGFCFKINKRIFLLAVMGFLISFLFRNADLAHNGLKSQTFLRLLVSFSVLFFLSARKEWYQKMDTILVVTLLTHVGATLFFFLFPHLWKKYALAVFKTTHIIGTAENAGYKAALNGHYSTNGTLIALAVCVLFAICLTKKTKQKDIVLLTGSLAALLLTSKRAHLVFVFGAMLILYYIANWKEGALKTILKLIGMVMAVGILAGILIKFVPAAGDVLNRFRTIGIDEQSTTRFQMWSDSIDMFFTHPLLGIGWGNYKYMSNVPYARVHALNVHNVYLQLLCETGIVGFMLFASMLIFSAYIVLHAVFYHKSLELSEEKYRALLISGMIQIFFLLYGFTGNFLYEFTVIYYFVAVAAGYAVLLDVHRYNEFGKMPLRNLKRFSNSATDGRKTRKGVLSEGEIELMKELMPADGMAQEEKISLEEDMRIIANTLVTT